MNHDSANVWAWSHNTLYLCYFIRLNRNVSLSEDPWLCLSLPAHVTEDCLGTPRWWQYSVATLSMVLLTCTADDLMIPSVFYKPVRCKWTFNLVSLEINCFSWYDRWLISCNSDSWSCSIWMCPKLPAPSVVSLPYWCTFGQGPRSGLSQQGFSTESLSSLVEIRKGTFCQALRHVNKGHMSW